MRETSMTRILVSSTQLREMLERQPEVELQLVRSAIPQLATLLAEKAKQTKVQIEKRVQESWAEIERDKNGKYGLPRQARDIITDWLRSECRDEAKILVRDEARAMAKTAADEAVAQQAMLKLGQDIEKSIGRAKAEVDEYIKESVEREVIALLRSGGLKPA